MQIRAIAFLVGILILQGCATLPSIYVTLVTPLLLVLALRFPFLRSSIWIMAGFLWAWFQAGQYLEQRIPNSLEGVDILMRGEIVSIPEADTRRTRFAFLPVWHSRSSDWPAHCKLRMSWYGQSPAILKPGQTWRLMVRLKRPNGYRNPGGTDYEAWLYQRNFCATGYVRANPENELLGQRNTVQTLRYTLLTRMRQSLSNREFTGLLSALTLGVREGISSHQWEVLSITGTNHLMAISGLHIGIMAGLFFWITRKVWSWFPYLVIRIPAVKVAACSAIVSAALYALLAGFSIPTQRALIMVVVAMLAVILDRTSRPSLVLAYALIAVLVMDSTAVLSAGFWLSFSAVAILLYGMTGYPARRRGWTNWGRAQWLVAIGLLPLTLFLFQQASIVSPLANTIAIPWVGFLVVPIALTGTALLAVSMPFADLLLQGAHELLVILWFFLDALSRLPAAQWQQYAPGLWALVAAALGVLLLLAPAGLPIRKLGLVFLLPLGLNSPPSPVGSEYWLTLLDVGQGLAAVVRTRNHVLVYDTGPGFSDHFDTGAAVVVPYLRQTGIQRIDTLIISHGDNDHIGGFESVYSHYPVTKLYSGVPDKLKDFSALACQAGQAWEWDGVRFEMLHPPPNGGFTKNDVSCVLHISSPGGSVLLTGDIHRRSERYLLQTAPGALRAEILVAPHHGSKSSSSEAFIDRVDPRYVLFPVGYRNRFHHPNARVLQRYKKRGLRVYTSSEHGAIMFHIHPTRGILEPLAYRQANRHYWSRDTDFHDTSRVRQDE